MSKLKFKTLKIYLLFFKQQNLKFSFNCEVCWSTKLIISLQMFCLLNIIDKNTNSLIIIPLAPEL